jgi:polyferredoxin
MAVSWPIVVLQVVAGTIASFLVGMIWFSSYGLGRVWWSYTFPNKKYGECTGPAEGYGIRKRERWREREYRVHTV